MNTRWSIVRLCVLISTALEPVKKEIKASSAAKGGLSPKIHATVDALGNPPALPSAQARAHDLQGAEVLWAQIAADTLITDKAFDML